MMGATTLNSLLSSSQPITRAGLDDLLPSSFSKVYFRDVGHHGQALWYVRPILRCCHKRLMTVLHRDSTKTFGRSYSSGTYIDASLTIFRSDYGFSSTRPVKGESLSTGAFARWYLDLFIDAAMHVSIYLTDNSVYLLIHSRTRILLLLCGTSECFSHPPQTWQALPQYGKSGEIMCRVRYPRGSFEVS